MNAAEFTAHVGTVHALLWHHAFRLSRGRAVPAEDLVQAALLALWADRHKAAEHPSPSHWFGQAGRWAMLRHLERQGRRACELDIGVHSPAVWDPEPCEFETLVELLPADRRQLVRERFEAGRTFQDLADAEGVTPAAVRQRVETALDHLRRHLTP